MNSPFKALPTRPLTSEIVDAMVNPIPTGWDTPVWEEVAPAPEVSKPLNAVDNLTLYTVQDENGAGFGLKQLTVVAFKIEFGTAAHAFQKQSYPALVFRTHEDATSYVRDEIRKQIRGGWATDFVDMLTRASLEHGMLDDAELNLADALRRYIEETK